MRCKPPSRRRALVAWARLPSLAVSGGPTGEHLACVPRPETEPDAARTQEFRVMAQADEQAWTAYLARITAEPETKAT